jgi:pimeloyl-ACP methyl ester carboxylesterase
MTMSVSRPAHRPITRLLMVVRAGVAAAGLVAFHGPAAHARTARPAAPASARPVIVLEHGAWADASSWDGVIARLQADGYTVYAPPNPLRGLPADSDYLHDFLTQNAALAGRPVILVGHSYGGAVISAAAVGDPEVKALVYVDAFIPAPGESISTLLAAQPGSCIGGSPATVFSPVAYPKAPQGDADLYLLPAKFPGCFASGLPASEAAVLAATQRPLAASAATATSGPVAWTTVPSWAVVGTSDQVIPPAELTFMARRAHARITDIPAGHLSLISRPGAVARVIASAALAAG